VYTKPACADATAESAAATTEILIRFEVFIWILSSC
jgi:hypothetical protein